MTCFANHTKAQLQAGRLALGLGLHQARTVDIASVAKACGYDWLFIDMEHSALNVETAAQIAVAALPVGITPLVRVPGKEHHHAARLLDAGAQGVVVPHVGTVTEAAQAVAHCKYPGVGHRSVMGVQPVFRYAKVPIAELTRMANDETLVIVMLETPAAIGNADEISAVPGVDVVMIGTNDLCAEMGIPGQHGHSRIEEAYRSVVAACRKHGKFPGMGGVNDPKLVEQYVGLGMRFILCGNDVSFMMAAASERARLLRSIAL